MTPLGLAGRHVLVAGAGVSGTAAARVLRNLGAIVVVVDVQGGEGVVTDDTFLPADTELVVTSPGWRPASPLLQSATARGVEIWGEVELGWRLRPATQDWLVVTGTNGKTTTTGMLGRILVAAGLRAATAGNIGAPVVERVLAEPGYTVLAVELSSFQLHWSSSIRPFAAAVVNVASDHVDWHGSLDAYAEAKAKVWAPGTVAVFDADDPGAVRLATGRPAVGVTRGPPRPGMLGVRDGQLVDEAFGGGAIMASRDISVPGAHNVTNALCAAALARAYGVSPAVIASGLRGYQPGAHRLTTVATIGGVRYVDDSKGTNPHATAAAISSYHHVVWIAGGLGKGADFDELVTAVRSRLRAAVLIGRCAPDIAAALARHAGEIPVLLAADLDNAVREASRLACAGDTVLLSPAAASMDMFADYRQRGEVFTAAVRSLAGEMPQEVS